MATSTPNLSGLMTVLGGFLQTILPAGVAGRDKVLPGQIARDALRIDMPRIATSDVRRITAILTSLGWSRSDRKDASGNFPYLAP